MTTGEFPLYTTEDGAAKLEVRMVNETVWLSLMQMAELFQRDKSAISRQIKNLYEDGELGPEATAANFATVQREGARSIERTVAHYNLVDHAGRVSHEQALQKAEIEFEKYRQALLNEASPVERHYEEAVKKLKLLEREKRKPVGKGRGKKN